MKISKAIAVAGALTMLPSAAYAAEGSVFGGPVGGTDIRNAYLPPKPGFYVGLVDNGFTADAIDGDHGVNHALNTDAALNIVATSVMYVYPIKVLGGTIATSVQQNWQVGHIDINTNKESFHGLGDTYSDLLMWSRYAGPLFGEHVDPTAPKLPYGLTVKAAYSMIFPTGKYDPTVSYSPGHNDFFFIPNLAVTYLTPPNFLGDGLEFSARFFVDIASKNHRTDYKTGLVTDLDFALTERHKRWQFGLAGFYSKQLQDDVRNDVPVAPDGKHLMLLYLGPVVALDFKNHSTLKLKIAQSVEVRNTLRSTRYVLGYSFHL